MLTTCNASQACTWRVRSKMGESRPTFPRGSARCRQGTAAPCPGPARHFQFQGVGAKLQLLLGHTMPSTPAASTARLAWGARPAQPNAFGMASKDWQQRCPCCAIVHAATRTPVVREGGAPSRTCTLAASLLGTHPANVAMFCKEPTTLPCMRNLLAIHGGSLFRSESWIRKL